MYFDIGFGGGKKYFKNWHDFCNYFSMSLFAGLDVATRGLSAAQLAINVTGQNITNAADENYSRKRIEQAAEWRRDGSYGQMGFGVEVYSINRVRNQFIDNLINREATSYGYYGAKSDSYSRIENIFAEPSDYALNSLLNNFWNGWSELANDPTSAGAREALRSTAQSLVTQFNYISTELNSYKNSINDSIEAKVNRINDITASIHRCNEAIAIAEAKMGNNANDTRDQRDALLQELAQLVDVDYFEDERGVLTVSSNGQLLVSGTKNFELTVKRSALTEQNGYQYSKVEISFAGTGTAFNPKQGELKALMEIRDVDIPKYEEYINSLAKTLITEVNKIHQGGYSASGLTFIDFFSGDSAANISISPAVQKDINNIAAASGGQKTSVNGLTSMVSTTLTNVDDTTPFYLESYFTSNQTNQTIDWSSLKIINNNTGATLQQGTDYTIDSATGEITLDPSLGTIDITLNFNTYLSTFTVPALDETDTMYSIDLTNYNTEYRFIYENSLVIKDTEGNVLQEGKDYDIDYQTGQITFRYSATNAFDNPLEIVISFDYHKGGFSGHGDGDNALLLSQLRDKSVTGNDAFGRSTQTINQFYSGMLTRLGSERNTIDTAFTTRDYALQQLKNQQKDIMGVSLDEEMANLIKYEYSYQASARYFSTIDSMLDTLLNM